MNWLGAVQSQDYPAAKWALGLRAEGFTDADIEQAFTDGTILRTHVMRPTWHFVLPSDIRWLLALTAPRVNAGIASRHRMLELDDALFVKSNNLLAKALEGGKQLTRPELADVLQRGGIRADDTGRLTHIIMRAELDAIICSGARQGRQFTYALLDERAPRTMPLERDEALAKLAGRYFASHGPATLQDFVWWSGLTMADARAGVKMVESELVNETIDGQTYWHSPSKVTAGNISQAVYLLPNFDEYGVGYRDRSAIFDAAHAENLDSRGNILFIHALVIGGQVAGIWKRTHKQDGVIVEVSPFAPLDNAIHDTLAGAAERYGRFVGLPVTLRIR